MEIISKVSRGSKMDQIYISKQRPFLNIGEYVIIKPLAGAITQGMANEKWYFYGIDRLERVKVTILHEILRIIDKNSGYENIIITGSFIDKGFHFNDIDILLVSEKTTQKQLIEAEIKRTLGMKAHVLIMNNKSLQRGLETDPLYQSIISRCVTVKRLTPIKKQKINYKILDVHLLKSRVLIDNFDILRGKEKYDLIRNIIAIRLFLKGTRVTIEKIHKEIGSLLKLNIEEIKENKIDKKSFLKKYKEVYNDTAEKILEGIKNDSKQT